MITINLTIKGALEQEQQLLQLVESIKADIGISVRNATSIDGVTNSDKTVACCTVSSQSLTRTKILDPNYYLQPAQANAVCRRIQSAKTVTELLNRITEMVETGVISSKYGNTIHLNNSTIACLSAHLS